MDIRRSAGSTTVRAPTVVTEGVASDSEVDLEEDTAPLEMPWLTECQPGGGNLWYIRDWGIASMFGYLREKRATEPVGKLPFPTAGMDAKLAEPDVYRQVPDQQGAALVEPDSAAGPANDVGSHPTFSEWRTAISIMPWLQETGMESSEADKENPDIVSEEPDMPGLLPRRDRGTVHLAWARWPHSRSAGERTADLARRSRPSKRKGGRGLPGPCYRGCVAQAGRSMCRMWQMVDQTTQRQRQWYWGLGVAPPNTGRPGWKPSPLPTACSSALV